MQFSMLMCLETLYNPCLMLYVHTTYVHTYIHKLVVLYSTICLTYVRSYLFEMLTFKCLIENFKPGMCIMHSVSPIIK